jgi:CheY-like chemotaxis protein
MTTTDKNQRVLIVDDHRDGADALGWLLEELGNEVQVTYCATQALEVAPIFRPDLIFTDLSMPVMDGYGLVRRFRQLPDFAQTKIIAVTGRKSDEHKFLALSAGFDAVLFKPISLTEIKAILSSVVPFEMSDRAYAPPSPHRHRGPVRSGADAPLSRDFSTARLANAASWGTSRLRPSLR